jgi:hypothetical protein
LWQLKSFLIIKILIATHFDHHMFSITIVIHQNFELSPKFDHHTFQSSQFPIATFQSPCFWSPNFNCHIFSCVMFFGCFKFIFVIKRLDFFFLLSKIISIIKMYNIIWVQYKSPQLKTRGVSQYGLVIYIQIYHKAKEKLWKFQYFTIQNIFLKQNPLKKPKILQDITTL